MVGTAGHRHGRRRTTRGDHREDARLRGSSRGRSGHDGPALGGRRALGPVVPGAGVPARVLPTDAGRGDRRAGANLRAGARHGHDGRVAADRRPGGRCRAVRLGAGRHPRPDAELRQPAGHGRRSSASRRIDAGRQRVPRSTARSLRGRCRVGRRSGSRTVDRQRWRRSGVTGTDGAARRAARDRRAQTAGRPNGKPRRADVRPAASPDGVLARRAGRDGRDGLHQPGRQPGCRVRHEGHGHPRRRAVRLPRRGLRRLRGIARGVPKPGRCGHPARLRRPAGRRVRDRSGRSRAAHAVVEADHGGLRPGSLSADSGVAGRPREPGSRQYGREPGIPFRIRASRWTRVLQRRVAGHRPRGPLRL